MANQVVSVDMRGWGNTAAATSRTLTNPFPAPAVAEIAGIVDDNLIINGERQPETSYTATGLRVLTYRRTIPAGGTLTLAVNNAPNTGWYFAGSVTWIDPVAPPASSAPGSSTAPASSAPAAVPTFSWWDVRPAARLGQSVRRTAWPASRRLTYSAGAGTTRAVAVIDELGTRRIVQAADFTAEEFRALDWIVVVDVPPLPSTVPAPTVPPASSGTGTAPGTSLPAGVPQAGQWVQIADQGTLRWVQLAPFACPIG